MKPIIKKALKAAITETTNTTKERFSFYILALLFLSIYSYFIFNYYISLTLFILDLIIFFIYSNEINKKYKKYKNDESYLPDGTHTIYIGYNYSKKVIITIKNGKRDSSYQEFYDNGQLYVQSNWKNGFKNGEYKEFYNNGQIYIQSNWTNDVKDGMQLLYSNQSELIQKSEYVNGKLIFVEEYYKNGNLRMKNIDENYCFFSEDNKKKCEILIDKISKTPKGVWINYDINQDVDYTLNFDLENKNINDALKTIYDASGKVISSKIISFIPWENLDLYINVNYILLAMSRFDGVRKGSNIKGPPGIRNTETIMLDPILCIEDLSNSISLYGGKMNIINENDEEKEITSLNKLNVFEYFESGLDKISSGDFEEAIIDFTKAIEFDGKYIDAFENRGRAKASLKDYNGAIEDFNKAIELDKESEVYSSRGRMKKNLLDYNGAMLDYNIALEKYPEDESSYFGRGELKYEIADYHGAIIDFNKCIEIKPNRIMSFHKRGDCKLKIEDFKGAIEDYSIVVQNRQDKYGVDRPPSDNASKLLASLYFNRGFSRCKIKEYNKAIEDLKKAIEINPDFEEAIRLLETLI